MIEPLDAPSPNHDARPPGQAVELLVLHYTGMPTGAAALARLRDPAAKVSAHWLVEEDGRVFRLVPEDRRAWHAGASRWRGRGDVNGRSIGVEIVNPGHEFGYRPFPASQMAAVIALCRDILNRHSTIRPAGVVGHSDVAPTRKEDPGELFDWPALARAGVGLWPEADTRNGADQAAALTALAAIGYDLTDPKAAVRAFQRRYRPARLDGVMDAQTARLVVSLQDRLVG